MRIGIITDVHEDVAALAVALDRFRSLNVDRVIVIGDVFRTGTEIEETCRQLASAGVDGVWGNHDFGLCREPSERMRRKYSPAVIDYMTSLQPRLVVDDCHFSHVEPWLDPENVSDLWYYEGPPDEHRQLQRIFDAVPQRILFGGHYHKWLLVTPEGIDPWKGDRPIRLQTGRYFVVIGPLCRGASAIFDTQTSELTPFNDRVGG